MVLSSEVAAPLSVPWKVFKNEVVKGCWPHPPTKWTELQPSETKYASAKMSAKEGREGEGIDLYSELSILSSEFNSYGPQILFKLLIWYILKYILQYILIVKNRNQGI